MAAKTDVPSDTFVCRETELAILTDTLAKVTVGRGNALFVAGESGSGKTLLLSEFQRLAQSLYPDLVVAWSQGSDLTNQSNPYSLFYQLTATLLSEGQSFPGVRIQSPEQAERLRRLGRITRRVALEVAPDAIGLLVPGLGLVSKGVKAVGDELGWWERGEGNPERLNHQITRLLQKLSETSPLLLILDDLHWADLASCSLFYDLVRSLTNARIMFVAAFRPHDVLTDHILWTIFRELRQYGAPLIDLDLEFTRPADQKKMREFVDAYIAAEFSPGYFDDQFCEALIEHTEGNALFVTELLRLGVENRWILFQQGLWMPARFIFDESIPQRLSDLIAQRLSQLPDSSIDILRAACVQGDEFAAQVLASVLRRSEKTLLKQLDNAPLSHIVLPSRSVALMNEPMDFYRFRHSLYSDYLYKSLSPANRRNLHALNGIALRDSWKDDWRVAAPTLVTHFENGWLWLEATEAILAAAESLAVIDFSREVAKWSERGISALSNTLEVRGDWQARLQFLWGWALYYQDDYQSARQHLETSLALYQSIRDLRGEALAYWALGYVHRPIAEYSKCLEYYERALHQFTEIGDQRGQADSMLALADTLRLLDEYGESRRICEKALNTYRQLGDHNGEADALLLLGEVWRYLSEYDQALECHEDAMRIYKERNARLGLAYSHLERGHVRMDLAQYESARDDYQHALSLFEEIDAQRGKAHTLRALGDALSSLGEYHRAYGPYTEALMLYRRIGHRRGMANTEMGMAAVDYAVGDLNKALIGFERVLEAHRIVGTRYEQVQDLISLGDIYKAIGNHLLASERYEQARDLALEIGSQALIQLASRRLEINAPTQSQSS